MDVAMSEFAQGGVLSTQQQAVEARTEIERRLVGQTGPMAVVLDFAEIRAVSTTFVDECLARLLSARLAGFDHDFPLMAVNVRDEVRHTIHVSLRPRRLLLLAIGSEGPEVIGGDDVLSRTMEVAFDLRRFTVVDFAKQLGLTPQAANNRLTYLARRGTLARAREIPVGGGRQFVYEVPPAVFIEADIADALAPTPRSREKRSVRAGASHQRRAARRRGS